MRRLGEERYLAELEPRTADVAVRGRALDLALPLNRRARPSVEVIGNEALLAHWLENAAFA